MKQSNRSLLVSEVAAALAALDSVEAVASALRARLQRVAAELEAGDMVDSIVFPVDAKMVRDAADYVTRRIARVAMLAEVVEREEVAARPTVNGQGKAIVDRCGDCGGCLAGDDDANPCTNLLVVFPNGEARHCGTVEKATRAIKAWFRRHANAKAFNVGSIEWRHGSLTS